MLQVSEFARVFDSLLLWSPISGELPLVGDAIEELRRARIL
jgi:hypothetical protein